MRFIRKFEQIFYSATSTSQKHFVFASFVCIKFIARCILFKLDIVVHFSSECLNTEFSIAQFFQNFFMKIAPERGKIKKYFEWHAKPQGRIIKNDAVASKWLMTTTIKKSLQFLWPFWISCSFMSVSLYSQPTFWGICDTISGSSKKIVVEKILN